MKLEKKRWFWLIMFFITGGYASILLASHEGLLDSNAWYAKGKNWLLGLAFLLLPFFIMLSVFQIEALAKTAAAYGLKYKEVYLSPYIWILFLIIPIIGWFFLIIMYLYLLIGTLLLIGKGKVE